MKLKQLSLALIIAIGALLTSCFGNDEPYTCPAGTSYIGDKNGNGKVDPEECSRDGFNDQEPLESSIQPSPIATLINADSQQDYYQFLIDSTSIIQ